jgi:non-ribosomal peptide synthetase component E (peptide arylation enzyme)
LSSTHEPAGIARVAGGTKPRRAAVKLDVDAIGGHLRDSLSKYKLPVEITILDDLPKIAVGKIAKPSLRQLLAANH